ncbi:MAG: hypothetical protein ACHP65_04845 [Legionellales bacterium]
MRLSAKTRRRIYAQLPENAVEMQIRLAATQQRLQSIVIAYSAALVELQSNCTQKLVNLLPTRRVTGIDGGEYYTEQPGLLENTHEYGANSAKALPQGNYQLALEAIAKSLKRIPELMAVINNSIFYERSASCCLRFPLIPLKNELAAKERLLTIIERQLTVLDAPSPVESDIEQLRYSVWQLGRDTDYGYQRNPFKIAGNLLGGTLACASLFGVGVGYECCKNIKYEDHWMGTATGGSGYSEHSFVGSFDLLFEDLSDLFSNKNTIFKVLSTLEQQAVVRHFGAAQSPHSLWQKQAIPSAPPLQEMKMSSYPLAG